ncbi:hypothetical protein [Mycoplasma suis]|uniref:Uncharacterized protein n=1 Tax=Mycoplasma suis (strain KI_3806) TaxID=708248 RepID=F0V1U5_MYCS3|nr:hypothetical protein [Mycoplasma suis]CBZ40626.1 hypothetical protein MSUIS_05330 [Mycoplasma suis KI3806]
MKKKKKDHLTFEEILEELLEWEDSQEKTEKDNSNKESIDEISDQGLRNLLQQTLESLDKAIAESKKNKKVKKS